MTSTPLLRLATEDDLALLLSFVRAFYAQFEYPYEESEKRRLLAQILATPALGRVYLVLSERGEPVGYLFLSFYWSLELGGRTAFIDEYFIAPEHRGRGRGTEVLLQVAGIAAELGIRALQLEAEPTNTRAVALYERLGFVDRERRLLTHILAPRS